MTEEGLRLLNVTLEGVRKGNIGADTIIINLVTNLSDKVTELQATILANITDNMLEEILGHTPAEVPEEPLL